jgi:hypothetical protein
MIDLEATIRAQHKASISQTITSPRLAFSINMDHEIGIAVALGDLSEKNRKSLKAIEDTLWTILQSENHDC